MNRFFFIILIALFLLRALLAFSLPLSGDEAYYWDCSRHLDWSYFDQPPLMIWQIALFRKLLGDNPLAVRLPSLMMSFGLGILILSAEKLFQTPSGAFFYPFLMLQLTPLFFFGSFYLSTDAGLIFFYTLSGLMMILILRGNPKGWLGLGLAVGLGFLSKFSIMVIALALFTLPKKAWRWGYLILSGILCFLLTIPVWIWALQHHGDNLLFQLVWRHDKGPFGIIHLLAFWVSQVVLLGGFAILASWLLARYRVSIWQDIEKRLLFMAGLAPLIFFSLPALRERVGAHWAAPGFVLLLFLLCLGYHQRVPRRWWLLSAGVNGVVSLILLFIVLLPGKVLQWFPPMAKPLSPLFGYSQVVQELDQLSPKLPIATESYTLAALVGFYSQGKHNLWLCPLRGGKHGLSYLYWQEGKAPPEDVWMITEREKIRHTFKTCSAFIAKEKELLVEKVGFTLRKFYLLEGRGFHCSSCFYPHGK